MRRQRGLAILLGLSVLSGTIRPAAAAPAGERPDRERPPAVPEHPAPATTHARARALAVDRTEDPKHPPTSRPGELLVRFAPGASAQERSAVVAAARGSSATRIGPPEDRTMLVRTARGSERAVQQALEKDPSVESADPNYVRSLASVPNDPLYPQQKPSLDLLRLERAWDRTKGANHVAVAVLDSGIDEDHPDLSGRILATETVVGGTDQDVHGHGTQVASLIAANDNSLGITGVAPDVKIISIRVTDAAGKTTDADIYQGIDKAQALGADVINMSLAGPGYSGALDLKTRSASAKSILVAAAGNDGSPVAYYPAGYPDVISVGATDATAEPVWWSNHGYSLSVTAPGVNLPALAAAPGATMATTTVSGTSFSSALVSGLAALELSEHRNAFLVQRWNLLRTATDHGKPGYDPSFGYGLVDAAAALGVAPLRQPPTSAVDPNGDPADATPLAPAGTSESIAPEADEDWFALTLAQDARVTVTVAPPAVAEGRTKELDPIIELFDAQHRRLTYVDYEPAGVAETAASNAKAGKVLVKVSSYAPSESPSPYSVSYTTDAWIPNSFGTVTSLGPNLPTTTATALDLGDDGSTDVVAFVASGDHDAELAVFEVGSSDVTYLPTIVPGGWFTPRLLVGDLDGDGDDDLLLIVPGRAEMQVFWQSGGTLTPSAVIPGSHPGGELWDLDGDGAEELYVPWYDNTDGWVRVWRWAEDHTASSTDLPALAGFAQPQIVRLGDVDGDDDIDIVAAQTRQVSTWLNTGGGWEHGPAWNEPTEIVSNLLVADVARGPEAELVIAFGTQVKVVGLIAADLETLTWQWHTFSGGVGEHLIDQGDGVPDLLLSGNVQYANPPASGVERFEGFPPGYFEPGELLPLSLPSGLSVSDVTDLTGDGVDDLLWATFGGLRMAPSTAVATAPEPGVVPTDSNAPQGATVSQSLAPTVTFSGALNGSTVASGIHLYDAQTFATVPATVTYDAAARRVTIKPTKALAPSTAFAIEGFGLKDAAGRDVPFYRTFKTGTGTRPKVGINGTYVPSPADFDANGAADLFLYNPTGNETMIFASRLGFQVVPPFNGAPSGIRFTTADFDGNGFEDLFGHWPGTGRDFVQLAGPNGFTLKYTTNVSGTYSPLAGDFDGDGFGDLMFYAPGGTGETIWWGAATGFGTTAAPRSTTSVAGTYKPITGDFDGDGDSDIIWFAAGTTADHLWKGNANRRFSPSSLTIIGRYRLAPTDFDGDGDDDVVLYAPGSTADKLWKASPTGFTTASLSIGGTYVPIGGDFNADGRGDLLLYAAGTTSEVVRWGTGTGLSP